jgi:hypothetical protein
MPRVVHENAEPTALGGWEMERGVRHVQHEMPRGTYRLCLTRSDNSGHSTQIPPTTSRESFSALTARGGFGPVDPKQWKERHQCGTS